jgi:hypothetical protein
MVQRAPRGPGGHFRIDEEPEPMAHDSWDAQRELPMRSLPIKRPEVEPACPSLWAAFPESYRAVPSARSGTPEVTGISRDPRGFLLSVAGTEGDRDYGVFCSESATGSYNLVSIFPGYDDFYVDDGNETVDNPWRDTAKSRFYKVAELGSGCVVEVNSDISGNVLWSRNTVYHVTTNVQVTGTLVIQPGTLVRFSQNGSLDVTDNGILVADGTPSERIRFTSDQATPDWNDYFSAVAFDGACTNSSLTYCIIEYAAQGVTINDTRLLDPIRHNIIRYCVEGIAEFGIDLTDVVNNQIYTCCYDGIYVETEDDLGQNSSESHILIQNNTIDGVYYYDGICVCGAPDPDDAATVYVYDNIVSRCFEYGIGFFGGWIMHDLAGTGYYDNSQDNNGISPELCPVYETTYPYDDTVGGRLRKDFLLWHCLKPSCLFIDAGVFAVSQLEWMPGTSVLVDQSHDKDDCTIGYHQRCSLKSMTDGIVVTKPLNGETVSGDIEIGAGVTGTLEKEDIANVLAFVDGHYVGSIGLLVDSDEEQNCGIQTPVYSNGWHRVTLVGMDVDENCYVAEHKVLFDNELSHFKAPEDYWPGVDYPIRGVTHHPNHQLRLVDMEGLVLWSMAVSGELNVTIPGSTFIDDDGLYEMEVKKTYPPPTAGGGIVAAGEVGVYATSGENRGDWKKSVSKTFKKSGVPQDVTALITTPDDSLTKKAFDRVKAATKCFKARGVKYVILYKKNCTLENASWVIRRRGIFIWYHIGHGDNAVGGTPRTSIALRDTVVYSLAKRDLGEEWEDHLYPNGCPVLPGKLEKNAKTLFSELEIYYDAYLLYVVMDACESATNFDLAAALGMHCASNIANHNQGYWGWEGPAYADNINTYNAYMENYWEATEDDKTIHESHVFATFRTWAGYIPGDNVKYQGYGEPDAIRLPVP